MQTHANTRCVVIGYCRPLSFQKALASALNHFEKDKIHCFIDGAKNSSDKEAVDATTQIALEFLPETQVICRSQNLGLRRNILDSISVVSRNQQPDWLLVLEDDILLKRLPSVDEISRFDVVNLNSYQSNDKLIDMENNSFFCDTYFVCWGWMVRSRVWNSYVNFQSSMSEPTILNKYFRAVQHKLPIGIQLINNLFGRSKTWAADFSAYISIKNLRLATSSISHTEIHLNDVSEHTAVERNFVPDKNLSKLKNQHNWLASKYTRKSLVAEKLLRAMHRIVGMLIK